METTVKITQGKLGKAYSGVILEDDVIVGYFSQISPLTSSAPMKIKFRTDGARYRFESLADTLTFQETIEAMLGK